MNNDNGAKVFVSIMNFILAIPNTLLRGFVLTKLWVWFLIPLGLPAIGIAHALGISTIIMFLTIKDSDIVINSKSDDDKYLKDAVKQLIVYPLLSLLALGFGYLYTLFM